MEVISNGKHSLAGCRCRHVDGLEAFVVAEGVGDLKQREGYFCGIPPFAPKLKNKSELLRKQWGTRCYGAEQKRRGSLGHPALPPVDIDFVMACAENCRKIALVQAVPFLLEIAVGGKAEKAGQPAGQTTEEREGFR